MFRHFEKTKEMRTSLAKEKNFTKFFLPVLYLCHNEADCSTQEQEETPFHDELVMGSTKARCRV
jgi:hypothetical protein